MRKTYTPNNGEITNKMLVGSAHATKFILYEFRTKVYPTKRKVEQLFLGCSLV